MSDHNPADRQRRGSISAFSSLFANRPTSTTTPSAAQPIPTPTHPRRMSITTLGLSGTSPKQTQGPYFPRDRRASISTTSSTSDSAIADDPDMTARSVPSSPYSRRMSLGAQAIFGGRGSGSGGTGTSPPSTSSGKHPLPPITAKTPHNHASPPHSTSQASSQPPARSPSDVAPARSADGLNWSEQFRSRAESAVHHRPSFGSAAAAAAPPPQPKTGPAAHERARSIADLPPPPVEMPEPAPPPPPMRRERRKPDEVGERMLRGEFLMD